MAATADTTTNSIIHNATASTPDTVARKIESPPSPQNVIVAPTNSKRRSLPPIVPSLPAASPLTSPVAPASAAGSAATPVAAPPPTPNPLPTPKSGRPPTPEPTKPSQKIADVEMETFQQILDLDEDDEDREFSRGMAWAYFSQAEETFKKMDDALVNKDLAKLSELGHFLKGSSAALGLAKVQASCENIQHYGHLRDEEAGRNLSSVEALDMILVRLAQVKGEDHVAKKWLIEWYDKHPNPER